MKELILLNNNLIIFRNLIYGRKEEGVRLKVVLWSSSWFA
jgi:hypothetical protein